MTDQLRIDFTPRPWQAEAIALAATHQSLVMACHRRAGKTHLVCYLLGMSALTRPGTRYAFFATSLKQAKRVAWPIFKQLFGDVPSIDFREAELTMVMPNGATVALMSGEDHDAARGMGYHGLAMDELAEYPADALGSILPCLSDTQGFLIALGTPRGRDLLFELAQRGLDPSRPDWAFTSFPASKTKVLPRSELERARRDAPSEATYLREYECSFEHSADDVLLPLSLVQAAMKRPNPTGGRASLRPFPRVVGVDCARFGGDASVFFLRQGPVAFKPVVLRNLDLMALVGHLTRFLENSSPVHGVCVDTGGLGAGVYDRLRQLGHDNVVPVDFGSGARSGGYQNRRVEMYDQIRRWLEQPNSMLPDDAVLLSDLSSARFDFNATNQMRLESKASIKSRLGRSPDLSDALALTFAETFEVPFTPDWDSEHPYRDMPRNEVIRRGPDYDPYADDRF